MPQPILKISSILVYKCSHRRWSTILRNVFYNFASSFVLKMFFLCARANMLTPPQPISNGPLTRSQYDDIIYNVCSSHVNLTHNAIRPFAICLHNSYWYRTYAGGVEITSNRPPMSLKFTHQYPPWSAPFHCTGALRVACINNNSGDVRRRIDTAIYNLLNPQRANMSTSSTTTRGNTPLSPISTPTGDFASCNCDASRLLGGPKDAMADGAKRDISAGDLEFRCQQLMKVHAVVTDRVGPLGWSFVTAWGGYPLVWTHQRMGGLNWCSVSPSGGIALRGLAIPAY